MRRPLIVLLAAALTAHAVNRSSAAEDSGGMSAGAVIGIILAVLAVAGIGGFFLYRHRRGDGSSSSGGGGGAHGKHFEYQVGSPQEVTIMGSHQTDYSLAKMERQSSQDMPIMAAAGSSALGSLNTSSYASSSANLHSAYAANNNPYGGNQYAPSSSGTAAHTNNATTTNSMNVTLYNGMERPSSPAASPPVFSKSTAKFLSGPDAESPPFKKTDVQLSRPSTSNLEETTEFGHSFTHSFAESYAESYSESYADRGYMSSFVQGMPGSEGLSVGAASAMGDALDRHTATTSENAHWLDAMDDMRGTADSYAMLEAYGSERGSAISRFSTDSEFDGGTSRQL
ncbi:hypothetical protein PybrP1_001165 [[Pythium] brassicae (nom. inval.)]|nr:hypothetical protein PybrP1_001165 [[Pythium] brassicae (nom. inval.)]